MTALLTGARWADLFAAVVSDSAPTDLTQWYYETEIDGVTPNVNINLAIQTESGVYSEPYHALVMYRRPQMYPFEYQRRSPRTVGGQLQASAAAAPAPCRRHQGGAAFRRGHVSGGAGEQPRSRRAASFSPATTATASPITATTRSTGSASSSGPPATRRSRWLSRKTGAATHFWMGVRLSSSALTEAHWVQVRQASYRSRGQADPGRCGEPAAADRGRRAARACRRRAI